jgi:hypothetical protein
MTQETLKWKLFPFSLIEKAKQRYTLAILDFEQREKESIGAA